MLYGKHIQIAIYLHINKKPSDYQHLKCIAKCACSIFPVCVFSAPQRLARYIWSANFWSAYALDWDFSYVRLRGIL